MNTSTSPKVQYGYASGSTNTVRPTSVTYPNGRVVSYDYGTSNGINDAISRVDAVKDGATAPGATGGSFGPPVFLTNTGERSPSPVAPEGGRRWVTRIPMH